ncbi:hypothetical protein J5N97_023178 [Dioscorea zingiberensis]|uniref:Actin-related protein 9 n=1 Tax=Dioscorea zingiberensis TaxID=325984 RepID=A0A9D5CBY5_9LILI|nr:hypothetical protein J5N97_023178 [Dioscorea zingiberensis]
MDYLRTVNPSQLIGERGSNLVVINPGSANIRVGFAHQQVPISVPHCIARHVKGSDKESRLALRDQLLNSQVTPDQHLEREKAYDNIAALLKIPFLDEEDANNSFPRKLGSIDGYNPHNSRSDSTFTWTNVMEKKTNTCLATDGTVIKGSEDGLIKKSEAIDVGEPCPDEYTYKKFICGEDALKISSTEPYCLHRPIRRGHFNVSEHYSPQQVFGDLYTIWDWILTEKLHLIQDKRYLYSVILVVPETFDNREIKEMLSIVLRDLEFGSAVVHQEGLAAAFGNGLSTACVVNIGAEVTSVICIEDGAALPTTSMILLMVEWISQDAFYGFNVIIRHGLLIIRDGEFDAVAIVHSYEEGRPVGSHKTRLSALNVPPMGLFYPTLFALEEYPPPPRTWFHDSEDMLEDTWHMDYTRRPDMPDGLYYGGNGGLNMWDNYPLYQTRLKKEVNIGLAEAITSSILSTGRLDLQRKLFVSIQLIGGVALTSGLVATVEERVLHSIPSNEAIDTVEVLQSRSEPSFVSWKGGAILGILDISRDVLDRCLLFWQHTWISLSCFRY